MTYDSIEKKQSAFRMQGISKSFGSVCANEVIDFEVYKGEIHALLGENGSGKSTLMNILSGVYHPDCGNIEVFGKAVIFRRPGDAIKCGIGMVYQHFKLSDALSAADNIIAGISRGQLQKVLQMVSGNSVGATAFQITRSEKYRCEFIARFAKRYDIQLNPEKLASSLSVSEKQSVEILKVLIRGAKILILDEPTAVLTPQEAKKLFSVLRKMRDSGCSIVFISHKLGEIMDLCDRVTVLRKGRSIETCIVSEVDTNDLVEKMVGRKVELSIERPKPNPEQIDCLRVESLLYRDEKGINKLRDVSFSVHYGEILGVAGLAGGGQKELCEAIAGIIHPSEGGIYVDNEDIAGLSPRAITSKGVSMCYIPEDRLGMGLVASMGMVENILLKEYSFQKGVFISTDDAKEKALEIVDELDILTPHINHPVRMLSGGNIQKVILGREIHLQPKLMIAAYAVRGLDIQSSYTIYGLLNEQKKKNVSVLYIGEDLDVLIALCDRIMVLCQGENMGIVNAKETGKVELGRMMSGTRLDELQAEVNHVSNS